MKTLYYFRHSSKDGANNSIGPKGLKLATKIGAWFYDANGPVNFDNIFHGELIRTAQTALAFMSGFGFSGAKVMPVVPEIGDDALFAEMVRPTQFRALASSMGNFRALFQCHDNESITAWSALSMIGVMKMFGAISDGETGVAFGHSPMIELALSLIHDTQDLPLPEDYQAFGDMEGVELTMGELQVISVIRKISVST